MDKWLEEALAEGEEAAKAHLNAVARIVGGHIARISEPNAVPPTIARTVEEMGKGVTAGMLLHHGSAGVMTVEMHSISRSGR
ncbi:hypothetical protein ACFO1S_20230 [Cohnella boryungensis]|uniref:Uncharacterized protein n=2 Tax=Cohnella boryungensis TaxID=768479 RepID=A0ABV8SDV7_9BACL